MNNNNETHTLSDAVKQSLLTHNYSARVPNATLDPFINYQKEHAGHDEMHMKIALFLMVAIFGSHLGVYYWKNKHFQSYQFITTVILYGLSLVYSINSGSLFTIMNWVLFTLSIIWVAFLIKYRLQNRQTPKLIYRFFSSMHTTATLMSVTCLCLYILLALCAIFGGGDDSPFVKLVGEVFSIILLNTVLYGVLYQDTAAIITDTLFNRRGIDRHDKLLLPTENHNTNVCLVCGLDFLDTQDDIISSRDKTCTISCGHTFHEDCIRGWCVIGKKDTCPYCFEKCDLRSLLIQPWQKTELYYGDLLFFLRILLAWNPIIVVGVMYITKLVGWK